jgi:hypothetical protein
MKLRASSAEVSELFAGEPAAVVRCTGNIEEEEEEEEEEFSRTLRARWLG